MQSSSTVLIFTSDGAGPVEVRRTRGGVEDFARKTADRVLEVSTESLQRSVLQAYRGCLDIIEALPADSGAGVLETVTFSLAINGEGQVGLLSTTAKLAAQVGLTFQVRIHPPASPDAKPGTEVSTS